ncbi:uncharacterized protein HMPREF1541_09784 [Cyphellophora europaea CBS 101466]|uniref:Uncharacterized protein n=1 Tax=Cyphellophora europaea (strain CBS 101466) TaxID=1220924 RepID=W2SAJ6_CYPE1|nr:uncharacterized protein HMPREF1541_09784 [Cyphellophora europaea CBS 101466]ETN44909.1 hypothetical protein HMPREF1541_09784 [Cyphellophora europaea CBS 101466]
MRGTQQQTGWAMPLPHYGSQTRVAAGSDGGQVVDQAVQAAVDRRVQQLNPAAAVFLPRDTTSEMPTTAIAAKDQLACDRNAPQFSPQTQPSGERRYNTRQGSGSGHHEPSGTYAQERHEPQPDPQLSQLRFQLPVYYTQPSELGRDDSVPNPQPVRPQKPPQAPSQTLRQVRQSAAPNLQQHPSSSIPTSCAVHSRLNASAVTATNRIPRFPLRVGDLDLAPLPALTLPELEHHQTAHTINELGQLYLVNPPVAPLQYGSYPTSEPNPQVLATRTALARFASPHWTTYPPHRTIPPRHNAQGGAPETQQPWLPPHAMPRHPALAYYGRDLSGATHRLPKMRAYVVEAQGNEARIDERDIFMRVNDGEATDRGWGPGVRVHPDMLVTVGTATEVMQRVVMEGEAREMVKQAREREVWERREMEACEERELQLRLLQYQRQEHHLPHWPYLSGESREYPQGLDGMVRMHG